MSVSVLNKKIERKQMQQGYHVCKRCCTQNEYLLESMELKVKLPARMVLEMDNKGAVD